MFDNCSVMIMCADEKSSIKRLEIDEESQIGVCHVFSDAVLELTSDKERVEFDGSYKPEQDEFLYISNFQVSDDIKDAIRNPLGVAAYEKIGEQYPTIRAIFIGHCSEEGNTEKFNIAFQRFRKEQYISTGKYNFFWSSNSFRREKEFGISISDSIDCYLDDDCLMFSSYYFVRQVFDLSGYYRSATDKEVDEFTSNESFVFDNSEEFKRMADTAIRRKIALINDSEVLKSYSALKIKNLAKNAGIDLTVKSKQIVIPNDKEQVKIILGFLDEEAYKGPFSQVTYLANSKRKISQK